MKVRAAALLSAPGKYETIEVELDGPRQNEVLVPVAAAGLCHSGDHIEQGFRIDPQGRHRGDRRLRQPDERRRAAAGPELVLYQKHIQGAIFGMANPTYDIPRVLDPYRQGTLKLDELISRRYSIDQVAQGYLDMHAGVNIRGVVTF